MTGIYTLRVLTDFAAAHTLAGYPGACAQMHGHNWKVEAEVEATALDDIGMAIDFKDIKRVAREIAGELDHRYLNDLPAFRDRNPTAEHIARWFFEEMERRLDRPGVRMASLTLWETDRACVRYSRRSPAESS